MKMQIALPVTNDSGMPPVHERLTVERVGKNRFRLLNSPGLIEGLAAGDEIAVDPRDSNTYEVVNRGGNLNVWLFFDGKVEENRIDDLRLRVEQIGGYLDGGTHRSLIFTVPLRVGFPLVEATFEDIAAAGPGVSWMFANVYDPVDGKTPLNWWR